MAPDPDPFWLFDRSRTTHPWQKLFGDLRSHDPERRWAVAANWRMDHRISPDRETGDLMSFAPLASAGDAESWWKALDPYFREELCHPASASAKTSAYARSTNASNLLSTKITGFDRLVHVGSLNAIVWRVLGKSGSMRIDLDLRDITGGTGLPPPHVGGFGSTAFNRHIANLANALLRRGSKAVRKASRLLADALGETEPPWWACYEHEVKNLLDAGNAESLGAALGLGHYEPGECLLLWIYRIDDAGLLYRPTVAEARTSPYHFPSPPDYELGITMPLEASLPACRELVHAPLKGPKAEILNTGRILFLASSLGQDSHELARLRDRHWARLRKEFYTDGLEDWAGRHPEPV